MALEPVAWFSRDNLLASADLDGGTEIAGFEVANLQLVSADTVFRSIGATAQVDIDLGSAQDLQVLILRFAPSDNGEYDGTEQLTLSASLVAAGDSEVVSQTLPLVPNPFTGCFTVMLDDTVSARYLRLSYPARDMNYLHVGALFKPSITFSRGMDPAPIDQTTTERSLFSGGISIQAGAIDEAVTTAFDVPYSERRWWYEMFRTVGKSKPFAFGFSQLSDRLDESFVAHFTDYGGPREFTGKTVARFSLEALL